MLESDDSGCGDRLASLESEKSFYDRYFEIAGAILLVLDRDGRVVRINKRGCALLRLDKRAIVGKDWFDLALPDSIREKTRADLIGAMAAGKPVPEEYENAVRDAAGETRLIAWKNAVVENDEGRAEGLLCSGDDVSLSRLSAAALAESEMRLKTAQRLAGLGSFHYDAASDRSFWSDELFALYGLPSSRGSLSIEEARSFLHPDDRSVGERMAARAKESGGSAAGEYRIVRSDGAVRHHHAVSRYSFGPDGALISVDGTIQDITERKEAEESLRRYKDELEGLVAERNEELKEEMRFSEALIDGLPGIFFACDESGKIVRLNSNLRLLLGPDAEGTLLEDRLDDVFRLKFEESMREAFRDGHSSLEVRFSASKGLLPVWYLVTLISFRAVAGASFSEPASTSRRGRRPNGSSPCCSR